MTAQDGKTEGLPFRKVRLLDRECPELLPAQLVGEISDAAVTAEIAQLYPDLPVWKGDVHTAQDILFTTCTPRELAELSDKNERHWEEICEQVSYPLGVSMVKAARVMTRVRKHGLWEQQQTHRSLVPYLMEETYELADAIAQLPEDPAETTSAHTQELVSELGDVFLEVLFHAAVGETSTGAAHFDYDDVAEAFLAKLHKRMPYAFDGGHFPSTEAEQDALWQESKAHDNKSPLDGIVRTQPALALVTQIVERARRAGVADEDIPMDFQIIASIADEGEGTAEELLRARALRFLRRINEGCS